ncbi:Lnb N-terminal periplasmic domain-containing protein [Cyclobacterium plantarum]|uniref:DUF4105 domain-containing protein n=1 Tax=Cyclobacterium plantarum TaxID=2716263 RepID=A0ABX0H833_9BACT|nr:DUF4105 domain-containing protein [Cyclobacterium plantarum]NHE57053.1 DUF4105 domain-containing protein [Cyclobacterium plantarum]
MMSMGLFLLLVSAIPSQAQQYKISLITCDPGDELYSTFGHSAIRIRELDSGQDLVFNYGTFDFNTPFFYVKFVRRTLDYQLSLTTTEQFLYEYNYFKRNVREQELNLSNNQAKAIVAFLQENYRPENRKYRYDFFFDNCSTRIREMMETVLGSSLKWNLKAEGPEKSFRNLIDEYVYPLPWSDLGIDLALGAVIDRKADETEKMFLPDYLEAAFESASIIGDGPERPLVSQNNTVYEFPEDGSQNWSVFNPYMVFWALAIATVLLTFLGFKRKRLYLGFDIGLFTVLGLLGLLLVFLWFFTEHSQTKNNWNIFWAFPLHLYLALKLALNSQQALVRKLLLGAMILADLALVIWILNFQSFHPSILPLLLIIIIRTNFLYYNLNIFNRLGKST